ncbi:MAG: N-acetylmuramoyl-L-alanine amidase [Lewinellaceae bacterium]|nr:N-acetylmuramoyl-L-alanine amidase [Saprospiraceae bacterium]MCB9333680.1 N-acetylmuramoyl-L-alanine amidase [Lewinellaceae bacterium]
MRKLIAQQTITTLLAWLLCCNINIATTVEHHPKNNSHPDAGAGKGREYCDLSTFAEATVDKSTDAEARLDKSADAAAHTDQSSADAIGLVADLFRKIESRQKSSHSYHIKTVVLDAGHGGKDPGCIGATSREKHNTLAIVLKLGAFLKEEFPDLKVIYTRDTDVFVELNERAAIANRNNADLFISVHCNAISVSHVKGTETYVMGLHTAASNLEVAKRENASIYLEDNYQKNYEGYDPNSAEAHIFGSVWQSAYLEQSILFASYVQQYTKELANRDDRGVKQAGFIVLHRTAMPSVLVEAGFLTNRTEEAFVASEEGQAQLAYAIFEAFRAYKTKMEGKPLAEKNTPQMTAKGGGNPQVVATSVKKPVSAPPPNTTQPAPANKPIPTTPSQPAPVQPTTRPAASNDQYADEIAIPVYSSKPAAAYRIYLMSWTSRLDKKTGQLSLLGDVEEEQSGGQFHYYTGKFKTQAEAEKVIPELRNLGFRTAKVVQTKPGKN